MLENNQELIYKRSLIFSVKLAKSITSKGWSITRESVLPLIPRLTYESECDIIVDGIPAKARLNLVPRLFFKSSQQELIKHLEKLIEDDELERTEVEMLLNHEDHLINENSVNEMMKKIVVLQKENELLKSEIEIYKQKNEEIRKNLKALSDIL